MKLGRASLITWMAAATAFSGGAACRNASSDDPGVATQSAAHPDVAAKAVTGSTGAPAGSAGSGAADPWATPPTKKDPIAHPMLWSAERDGKTTYFLGTIHVGVDAELRMPDLVWTDFDAEPTFAMETDVSGIDASALKRTDGGSLHADLGADYWKKLQATVTPRVATAIDDQKPAVAASLMSLRGLPQTPPMDELFFARAQNKHKQIVFLEPAAKQLALLDKWLDVRALKEMLDDADSEKHSKEMLDAYVTGDTVKMVALSDSERADFKKTGRTDAEYDEQMDEMLYARNASWIEGIEKLHAAGGGFVAVGAMHLIGPRSVLELLSKAGFKITRLP